MSAITHHGYARGKERLGFSKKTLKRMTERALAEGLQHKDTKGSLKKYIDGLFFHHQNSNIRIYAAHLFVFTKENVLITVYRIPHKMTKRAAQHARSKTVS